MKVYPLHELPDRLADHLVAAILAEIRAGEREEIDAGRAAAAESAASEASAEFGAGYSPWTSEGVNT